MGLFSRLFGKTETTPVVSEKPKKYFFRYNRDLTLKEISFLVGSHFNGHQVTQNALDKMPASLKNMIEERS